MFYSQDILQKRGGKFGIVWLAATRPTDLRKRDYYTVDIRRTCEQVIAYITLQVLPEPSKLTSSRPRLSLYLSSQLMCGVVRVYGRQQQYLFAEVTNLCTRFQSCVTSTYDIDLKASTKDAQVNTMPPIDLCDLDVEFGRFLSETPLVEDIPSIDVWVTASPMTPGLPSRVSLRQSSESPKTPKSFRPEFGSPNQVASVEEITMKEVLSPSSQIIEVPGEKELPSLGVTELEALTDNEDAFRDIDQNLEPLFSPTHEAATDTMQLDLDEQRLPPGEETPAVFPDLDLLLASPRGRRGPLSPQVTPVPAPADDEPHRQRSQRADFTMELSPLPESPAVHRRKRRLVFADVEIQIPKKQMRHNLAIGATTCAEFDLAEKPMDNALQLLEKPARRDMRGRRFSALWHRNAVSSDFQETDSAKPAWTVPRLGVPSSSSGSDHASPRVPFTVEPALSPLPQDGSPHGMESVIKEQQSVEIGRDVSSVTEKSRLQMSGASQHQSVLSPYRGEGSLLSEEDQSVRTSTRKPSIQEQTPDLEPLTGIPVLPQRAASVLDGLETLHEEPDERLLQDERIGSPLGHSSSEDEGVRAGSPSYQHVIRQVNEHTGGSEATTFRVICPLQNSRKLAARLFYSLLETASRGRLRLSQTEAYGDIYITRGPRW